MENKCLFCEKIIKIKKGRGKNYRPVYCSKECKNKHLSIKNKEKTIGKIKVNCCYCSKEIAKNRSQIKRTKNSFCNCECSINFRKNPNNHKKRKGALTLPNGYTLFYYASSKGANPKTARKIYKNEGPDQALKYIEKYKKKTPKMLLDGSMSLNKYCDKVGIPTASANKIYNNMGPELTEDFIKKYKPNNTSIEVVAEKVLGLKKYNKKVIKKFKYRPDFKINENTYLEIDGLYWHSMLNINQTPKSHYTKREAFDKEGLRLIQIREDELLNKPDIVKSMVNVVKKEGVTKISARNTIIKPVESFVSYNFFEENHLMGGGPKTKSIGLYYKDELVMCLSYKKYKKGIDISRIAAKQNLIVVGGTGKLIKWIEKNINPDFIQSFVDLRYGTGKSLELLGFERKSITLGWKWTDRQKTYNRLYCKAGNGYTEKENAQEMGLSRIYDAGQAKYVKYF